jgi:hypothetical protein
LDLVGFGWIGNFERKEGWTGLRGCTGLAEWTVWMSPELMKWGNEGRSVGGSGGLGICSPAHRATADPLLLVGGTIPDSGETGIWRDSPEPSSSFAGIIIALY